MRSTASRTTSRLRLRAVLVVLAAVLGIVLGCVRAPSLGLSSVVRAHACDVGGRAARASDVDAIAEPRGAVVRPARAEPRAPRLDTALGASTLSAAARLVPPIASPTPATAPEGTWTPAPKSHVELMVFLN